MTQILQKHLVNLVALSVFARADLESMPLLPARYHVFARALMFGIHDMYSCYWLVLFSASCFANLMGLNIWATFNSVVTIYILIPFLIIPQIILSGVIVKFYNLNPVVTTQNKVPPIGEIMASRWAFVALAVHQFKENKYAKLFFEIDKATSNANFKKGPWMEKMNDKLDSLHGKLYGAQQQYQLQLFNNELQKELAALGNYGGAYSFNYNSVIDDAAYNKLKEEFKNKVTSRKDTHGESYSGSTAWHNSARSRLFLSRERGLIKLLHEKSTHGQACDELRLVWPEGGLPQLPMNFDGLNAAQAGREADNNAAELLKVG